MMFMQFQLPSFDPSQIMKWIMPNGVPDQNMAFMVIVIFVIMVIAVKVISGMMQR